MWGGEGSGGTKGPLGGTSGMGVRMAPESADWFMMWFVSSVTQFVGTTSSVEVAVPVECVQVS